MTTRCREICRRMIRLCISRNQIWCHLLVRKCLNHLLCHLNNPKDTLSHQWATVNSLWVMASYQWVMVSNPQATFSNQRVMINHQWVMVSNPWASIPWVMVNHLWAMVSNPWATVNSIPQRNPVSTILVNKPLSEEIISVWNQSYYIKITHFSFACETTLLLVVVGCLVKGYVETRVVCGCSVDGISRPSGPIFFSWLFNGKIYANATDISLMFCLRLSSLGCKSFRMMPSLK